ncbi:MAG: hypothetical protein LBH80_03330 [Prevotellaceae bacterium]|jgi:hypothetical protein|nr:hypothetical protein [Prevotellaceae bacterium]
MKKLSLSIFLIGIIFTSCGGNDPQPQLPTGSVEFDNTSITMVFGQQDVIITPTFKGSAEKKPFDWTSSDADVVSVRTLPIGLKGALEAKRITREPVKITLQAKDGSMQATCHVTVKERSIILANVRYPHGKNHTEIRQNAPQYYELETEADANPLIYKSTLPDDPKTDITHYVYYFDNNGKVNSMQVLLKGETLANSAIEYLEERYPICPNAGEGGTQFYDLSSDELQPAKNTVAGVFQTKSDAGTDIFGVKYKLK